MKKQGPPPWGMNSAGWRSVLLIVPIELQSRDIGAGVDGVVIGAGFGLGALQIDDAQAESRIRPHPLRWVHQSAPQWRRSIT